MAVISNFLREHSYATTQTFRSDLSSIRGDARNYVFTGQTADLDTFQESVNTQALTQLKLPTRDNPEQSTPLRRIGSALDEVIAYSQQLVDARNAQGIEAAMRFESNGLGIASMNNTVAEVQAFTDEENRNWSIPGTDTGPVPKSYLSRRDGAIVAWHEVPGKGPLQRTVP